MTKEESFGVSDKDKVGSDLPIITLNQKSKATIMDKVRWGSHAKLVIIDDLTIPPKTVLYFKSVLHVPPLPLNATLKIRRNCGDVFSHFMWGGGRGRQRVFVWIFVLRMFQEPRVHIWPKIFVHDCSPHALYDV